MKNLYPRFLAENPVYDVNMYTNQYNGFRYPPQSNCTNDTRLGGFLVPFLTGAIVSAPFWYLGAQNRYQSYPPYYPYPNASYYPYPNYR